MAFNSIFIRRFSSSTGIRSPGRSISLLNHCTSTGGQFIPIFRYSTAIDRKIVSLVNLFYDQNSDKYPKVTSEPADYPFTDIHFNDGKIMLRRSVDNREYTEVVVHGDTYKVNDIGTPKISLNAMVAFGSKEIEYEVVVEPKKINIQSIKMWDDLSYGNLSIFKGYLSAKGINAKMMDVLFNFLGKQQHKEQLNDGLNALLRPFKIKDGGPEAGYLTLIKNRKYEIIEVKVRPRYLINKHEVQTYDHDNHKVQKDERFSASYHEKIISELGNVHEVKNVLKLLAAADYEKSAEDYKMDLGDIKSLYVLVDIHFGVDYKECLKFYLVAYPNKIHIRSMYRTSAEGSTEHLEEYEESFKKRVMKPSRLKDDLSYIIMKFLSVRMC